ncbi:MAG: hypothetical protein ACYDAO_07765 [Thermoplasmataceae archaeon]
MDKKLIGLILSVVAIILIGTTFAVTVATASSTTTTNGKTGPSTSANLTLFGINENGKFTSWSNFSSSISKVSGQYSKSPYASNLSAISSQVNSGVAMISASIVALALAIVFIIISLVITFVVKPGKTSKILSNLFPVFSIISLASAFGLYYAGASTISSAFSSLNKLFGGLSGASVSTTTTISLSFGAIAVIAAIIIEIIYLIMNNLKMEASAA